MIQDINKQIYFNKQWKCYSAAKLSSLSMESETKKKWFTNIVRIQGRIQDFKLGGAHLKKLRRVEEGAKYFGVFRVRNHDFTP